jgi:hypothetical protein
MFQTTFAPMTKSSSATEVNKVYKTNDLSIFKDVIGNRVPNPQHVRRLSASIKENGMLCNPILVNEDYKVIDGQHRLLASKEANSFIYFIILNGYNLSQVHTLNLNQKNWTKKDFMDGYVDMGLESYIKLKEFTEQNQEFTFNDCIAMCSNSISSKSTDIATKFQINRPDYNLKEIFVEGTWVGKDFELAQEWAEKIKLIKTYYSGYNRNVFVATMIGLFKNNDFDYSEFMHKIRLQPKALVDCTNIPQQRLLIEEIYNYKSRNKINLRY